MDHTTTQYTSFNHAFSNLQCAGGFAGDVGCQIIAGGGAALLAGLGAITVWTRALAGIGTGPGSQYIGGGPGARHAKDVSDVWIKRSLFKQLQQLVGKSDARKFAVALQKGIVGPTNQSGIKILREAVNGYTHELKITGSAQRLLGKVDDYGVLVFDKFVRGGLH